MLNNEEVEGGRAREHALSVAAGGLVSLLDGQEFGVVNGSTACCQ